MRTRILFLSFIILFLQWNGVAQTSPQPVSSEDKALNHPVRQFYLSSIEAFNAKDIERFLMNFSSDIKMYGTDGIYEGKQALRDRFSLIFERFPSTKMEIPELALEVLSDDVVLVHFSWKVYPMGTGPAYSGKGSGLYLNREGNWVEILEAETVTEIDEALKQNR